MEDLIRCEDERSDFEIVENDFTVVFLFGYFIFIVLSYMYKLPLYGVVMKGLDVKIDNLGRIVIPKEIRRVLKGTDIPYYPFLFNNSKLTCTAW